MIGNVRANDFSCEEEIARPHPGLLPQPERFSLTLAKVRKSHSEFALNGDFLLEIWGTVW
jgi:hypothetical protein